MSVALLNLVDASCRWPSEGDETPFLFCGEQRTGTTPYCAEHTRLAYTKSYVSRVRPAEHVQAAGKAALAAIARDAQVPA